MDKNKLLKGLASIALIFLLCIMGSKLLFGSSETLMEYAQKNPEIAYSDTANPKSEPTTKDIDTSGDLVSSGDIDASGSLVSSNDIPSKESSVNSMTIEDDDFVFIEEGFYYGNLSAELQERITGVSYPQDEHPLEEYPLEDIKISYSDLQYLHVLHFDFNGEIQEGELICNKAIAKDLSEIFQTLYNAEYQIEKIKLIDEYLGDDDASMTDNNTSCFNYRLVENTSKLSKHAYGLAIDINPFYNPYVRYNKDGSLHVDPKGSEAYVDRNANFPYKIDSNDLCYRLFTEKGFTWGGDWNSSKDYQHFQITIPDFDK